MQEIDIGTVIAERVLDLPEEDGMIKILVGMPRKTSHDDFITPYRIVGIGDEKVRLAAGVDSTQALQLVFKMIGADLHDEQSRHRIEWLGRSDLGFPQP
jgi:hypothetical protein